MSSSLLNVSMELYLLWHIELKTTDRTGIYFTSGMDLGLGLYFLFLGLKGAHVLGSSVDLATKTNESIRLGTYSPILFSFSLFSFVFLTCILT